MKYLFLRSVKVQEHIEEKEEHSVQERNNICEIDLEEDIAGEYSGMGFDDDIYEQDTDSNNKGQSVIIRNIDDFRKYSISFDNMVTHKEARTSIEEKRTFIVAKRGKKKSFAEDIDTIYKTLPKMKIADKNVQRIGFITADKKAQQTKLSDRKKKKYRGIANEEFLISRRKGFNQKKVGYLQLMESTASKDLYVEVTTNRGYKWLAALIIIIGLIGAFIGLKDWDGWHLAKKGLTLYKTEEIIEYKESALNISLNATPVLKDGNVNINLSSEQAEGITFIARLYLVDTEELVYESKEIQAGEGISKIQLLKSMSIGENRCRLECESYRNGNYLGVVESELIIDVKESK